MSNKLITLKFDPNIIICDPFSGKTTLSTLEGLDELVEKMELSQLKTFIHQELSFANDSEIVKSDSFIELKLAFLLDLVQQPATMKDLILLIEKYQEFLNTVREFQTVYKYFFPNWKEPVQEETVGSSKNK